MLNPNAKRFETPQGYVCIHDVVDNHVEFLDALLDLYGELFPQYSAALPRVREKALLPANADPRFIRHQWVITCNEYPAGLASFKLALRQNLGICLSIGIRPAYRSMAWQNYRRFSEFVIQQMIRQLELDAGVHGIPSPAGLVVEVEMAACTTDPVVKKSRLHLLERYREYGFVPLPVRYHEPAYVRNCDQGQSHSQATNEPEPMQLLLLFLQDQEHLSYPDLLGRVVDALLVEHYGLSEDDWVVQQARESITRIGEDKNGRNN
jgi:hypothetical protein